MSVKKSGGTPHPNAMHPLFPIAADAVDADLTTRDISWIYIKRNGEQAPQKFAAKDLQEEDDIFSRFGGGKYELRARDETKARWTAYRDLVLPGAPRPLDGSELPAPTHNATAAPSGEGVSSWVKDIVAIGSVLVPVIGSMLDSAAKSNAANTQMLIACMTQNKPAGPDPVMLKLLDAAMAKNPSQEMAAMLQTGIQLGSQTAMANAEQDLGSTMGTVIEGINAVTEMQKVKLAQEQASAGKPAGSG
jgi:hypothetical protein